VIDALRRSRVLQIALLAVAAVAVVISQSAAADGVAEGTATNAGWLKMLPPVMAIFMALAFRQVVPALLAGIWAGAWIVNGDPLIGLARTVDRYIAGSLSDPDRAKIVIFTLLLGGMVGIISRSGGTLGLVDSLSPLATTKRRGQVVTWMLGIAVFFDDYANTLLVGNTMRPVTDRLKISREKLAYIVDSTAAPVASIALVSTWIGYEISLIGSSMKEIGRDVDPYAIFLQSLPYNFYPVLALVFGIMVATTLRDFGPMLKAERRAAGGELIRSGSVPLADFENKELAPPDDVPRRWPNAVIPVALVLIVTFIALWITGRANLTADGNPMGQASIGELGFEGLGAVFSSGSAYDALMYAAFAGCAAALSLAMGQRIVTMSEGLGAWVCGMKGMMAAMVTLILAWGIGTVCSDLKTADFLVGQLSDSLHPGLIPSIVFILAAATAFATGTSWATMSILIPLAVPIAVGVTASAGYDAGLSNSILLASISSVLAGALFGDHCSPISDTTVLSSMSSGCDHIDHVRTQLPYSLTVAAVALIVGYLPAGFGVSPWIGLVVGAVLLFGVLRLIGKKSVQTA
jgi:Na+/H+ antiporter NhaC